ncbi:alpha-N-acetylglucosaminidase [Paenibacillus sp. NPDC056579]|uniref:alpha-N-acetylglucosaminidase n=1 Tax=Paenibacillus sp. NPDC056579 TaxID=3345871 RepID=UPI0036A836E6
MTEAVTKNSFHKEVVSGLVSRLLGPAYREQFDLEEIGQEQGRDVFEIENRGKRIVLRGSNGISLASALHWYLKYSCNAHISWSGDQLSLPDRLPQAEAVRKATPYRHRYMYNFCTFNYSMTWWDWKRWEREIDWMALHGINMPLAVTGQEAVWMAAGNRMGLSDEEMLKHLTGPAYLAWHYMGNVDGMAGPLPQSWIDGQKELQLQILEREREFGMTPVLAGFYGHVPAALRQKRPEANIMQLKSWFGMRGVHFLDPRDPLFDEAASIFYEEQEKLYGTDHLYAMDLFHEGSSPDSSTEYVTESAKAVCQSMLNHDPDGVWVMQSWSMSEPIVTSLPREHLLMLDLYAENNAKWKQTHAFYGKPWVWCMLHNFGGRNGMFGDLEMVAQGPAQALHDPGKGDMAGIGFAPEAIEENPVFYDLLSEMVWRTEAPDLDEWVEDYLLRRYGNGSESAVEAWQLLRRSVYSKNSNYETVVCARPKLEIRRTCNGTVVPFYDVRVLLRAWERLLAGGDELAESKNYQYDLVNVGRQVLSDISRPLHLNMIKSFRAGDREQFNEYWSAFEALMIDMEELLATNVHFLTGPWVNRAKKWGTNKEETALHEFNARTIISTWWPEVTFDDYAHKQWSGIMTSYYLERWRQFAAKLEAAIDNPDTFSQKDFDSDIRKWEFSWMKGTEDFSLDPSGDAAAVSRKMYEKYAPMVDRFWNL